MSIEREELLRVKESLRYMVELYNNLREEHEIIIRENEKLHHKLSCVRLGYRPRAHDMKYDILSKVEIREHLNVTVAENKDLLTKIQRYEDCLTRVKQAFEDALD